MLGWCTRWRGRARAAWRLAWASRLALVEAVVLLALARGAVLLVPFRRIAPWLGLPGQDTAPECDIAQQASVRGVAWAIHRVSPHTPWWSNCLAQAIAGKLMLRRRGVPTTLYLGVDKTGGRMRAHAWLRAGATTVTGAGAAGSFVRVTSFGASA